MRRLSNSDGAPTAPLEPMTRLPQRPVPAELLEPSTDVQLLRMALEEWGMILLIAIGVSTLTDWWYLPALPLLAGRYHALGVILHDASHTRARSRSATRLLLEALCGLPIATTLPAMRYHHLRHHREDGGQFDPYHKDGEQTLTWWTVNTLRGALLYPFWFLRAPAGVIATAFPEARTTYARIFLQDRSGSDLRDSREVITCAQSEKRQLLFQGVLIAAYVRWPLVLVAFHLLPVIVAGILSARRLLVEHRYEASALPVEGVLSTARDNHLGWLGAIALAPRNVGYHVVHHLHPRASLTSLPKLREWYRHHPDRSAVSEHA